MNPLTNLPQILIGELERTMKMFLAWFWDSWVGWLLYGKIAKIVFYDQAEAIMSNMGNFVFPT